MRERGSTAANEARLDYLASKRDAAEKIRDDLRTSIEGAQMRYEIWAEAYKIAEAIVDHPDDEVVGGSYA